MKKDFEFKNSKSFLLGGKLNIFGMFSFKI